MSIPRASLLAASSWLALVTLLIAACAAGDTAADANPSWDSDGDTISTAVELESHNRYLYSFDTTVFNYNPSIASGTRGYGDLNWGLNLPDTGTGYIHYLGSDPKDTDDWGTLALINVGEAIGRNYRGSELCHPQTPFQSRDDLPRPQFGDMSLQWGGLWYPDHAEHQNGLDVDVRYLRFGPRQTGESPLNLANAIDRLDYDSMSTRELIQCFLNDDRVIHILYDLELTGIYPGQGETKLINRNSQQDHTDHFHVRVADPDGAN